LARRAARVFGIVSTSPAAKPEADLDSIAEAAEELVGKALVNRPGDEAVLFRVAVKRADKSFPRSSMECAREIGTRLTRAYSRLRVDLGRAELTLGVEIRPEGTFLFLDKIQGSGGLPVGIEGRVMALLSGGIDSPVAAWLMMKRGCRVELLHFDSRPFTGQGSLEKVRTLARRLSSWQGETRLFVAPFAGIQIATRNLPDPGYRTLLYRRFMHRIAERLALREGCQAIVTGDNLGQVASQTLHNLSVIDAASVQMSILRPLLGHDKDETVRLARKIGTFETSILPFEDCCTLFQPEKPVTAGRRETARRLEDMLDVEALVRDAVLAVEVESRLARPFSLRP
ncbi:MAG: tRNA uracil 4-sulfurtransferase ThiI, partial [Planctomycetota bacterium]